MKARINKTGEEIFRNDNAIVLYNNMRRNPDVYECGINDKGYVYFAFLNGTVQTYTRRQFIRLSTDND